MKRTILLMGFAACLALTSLNVAAMELREQQDNNVLETVIAIVDNNDDWLDWQLKCLFEGCSATTILSPEKRIEKLRVFDEAVQRKLITQVRLKDRIPQEVTDSAIKAQYSGIWNTATVQMYRALLESKMQALRQEQQELENGQKGPSPIKLTEKYREYATTIASPILQEQEGWLHCKLSCVFRELSALSPANATEMLRLFDEAVKKEIRTKIHISFHIPQQINDPVIEARYSEVWKTTTGQLYRAQLESKREELARKMQNHNRS